MYVKHDSTTNTDINKNLPSSSSPLSPIQICNRIAPLSPDVELHALHQYGTCPLLHQPPDQTTILLLEGIKTFGRTGNNLIEFFHALQYGRDQNVLVGVMRGSWPTHLITEMWMSLPNRDWNAWAIFMEQSFCIKMIESSDQLESYKNVIRMDTRDLFIYRHKAELDNYVEFTSHVIRTLWRYYNNGSGMNILKQPTRDMCSVMDAIFGTTAKSESINSAIYSVVHSRSFEGKAGHPLMDRIAASIGCDPIAALEMEPEYVKGILGPLGMLQHPIYFISDHQRPEILERLLADPEIGPLIRLVPEEASWIGGDITLAINANVFIGSPASTFSGFIAKSRVALGYNNNFLFRKRIRDGTWVEVCDYRCVFDKDVLKSMA